MFNSIDDEDDQLLVYEPRRQEQMLRRWVIHFHSEVIRNILLCSNNRPDLYCKYFELRPYSYAI